MSARRLRPTVRVRLTALYAGLFVAGTGLVLLVSYELMGGHLRRTLRADLADDVLDRLAAQYALAVAGTALLALALGWLAAGRALAPLRRITETAHRIGAERLDERIALEGPDDEIHELAATFNAMLDRVQGAVDAQRRFIANAGHELRSPLTVIRAEVDVTLSDPSATTEDLRAMGAVVLEATDRTNALLDGLMTLARSQQDLLRRDAHDLATAARRAVNQLAEEAAGARVRLQLHPEPAPVVGEEALLDRLAANLVENAVRYNVAGGTVDVRTRRAGVAAELRVVNDGPRVRPEDVQRLLQPFERLDRASGRPGTGLGLSIVRAVVEAHGGRLQIEARQAGGLDVAVLLPAPTAARDPEPSAGAGSRA